MSQESTVLACLSPQATRGGGRATVFRVKRFAIVFYL